MGRQREWGSREWKMDLWNMVGQLGSWSQRAEELELGEGSREPQTLWNTHLAPWEGLSR